MTALTMGIGHERAIKEKATQIRIASDPEPALEETALPLALAQSGRLGLRPSDNSSSGGDRVDDIMTWLAITP
jgi:hypothetical protein